MSKNKRTVGKDIFFLMLICASIVLSIFVLRTTYIRFAYHNTECCYPQDFTGKIDHENKIAVFEGNKIEIPKELFQDTKKPVLGVGSEERWIEVDLSDQKLFAWEADKLFLETPISTGLPHTPTPEGEFRIWIKLRATRMEGGEGRYYYNLPNVPYTMYFYNDEIIKSKGYGLHGAYWHNDFGNPRSHGCVNLPIPIAKELYYWTNPTLVEGKNVVYSSESSPGTRIVIHQ